MQMNRIEIAGYLAAKPELRYLPSGTKVANARLGETYRFVGLDGKPQSHTNWHSLVFYNNLADVAMTYEQGENIHLEGSLQQRKFKPADGANRTVHEIHVRTCHIIGAARISQEPASGGEDPEHSDASQDSGGIHHDETWPVAPA